MRNIFDQYNHWENRVTHSLVTVLHQDRKLLKSFLNRFGPKNIPDIRTLRVIGQGLPGIVASDDEEEPEKRGLPDAVISNEKDWALVIESKIQAPLTPDQLQRHSRTIQKCGIDDIHGLSLTVDHPSFALKGWRMATWKDVYAWANESAPLSAWAKHMVEYFNVSEVKMVQDGYMREGTITKFTGINFDPDAYTEQQAKRVLRLLTDKIRMNKSFMKEMDDRTSKRDSMRGTWDYISFKANRSGDEEFNKHLHYSFGTSDKGAGVSIIFPHEMKAIYRKKLIGPSYHDFSKRIQDTLVSIKKNLRGIKGYKPVISVDQRHGNRRGRGLPLITDGRVLVDLRACFGGKDHDTGKIKKQEQWLQAIHELLKNKRSNMQCRIGIDFPYASCLDLKTPDADRLFMKSIRALRPFVSNIIE